MVGIEFCYDGVLTALSLGVLNSDLSLFSSKRLIYRGFMVIVFVCSFDLKTALELCVART